MFAIVPLPFASSTFTPTSPAAGRNAPVQAVAPTVAVAGDRGGHVRPVTLVVVRISPTVDEVLEGDDLPLVEIGMGRVDSGVDDGGDQVARRVRGRIAVRVSVERGRIRPRLGDAEGRLGTVVQRPDDPVLLHPPDDRQVCERLGLGLRNGRGESVDDVDPLADAEAADLVRESCDAARRSRGVQRHDHVGVVAGGRLGKTGLEVIEELVAVAVHLRRFCVAAMQPPSVVPGSRCRCCERKHDGAEQYADSSEQAPADRKETVHVARPPSA
jgi:hypothetical protein